MNGAGAKFIWSGIIPRGDDYLLNGKTQLVNAVVTWPSINTGLDNVHVIFCIYEQEACYVINIFYIVTVY